MIINLERGFSTYITNQLSDSNFYNRDVLFAYLSSKTILLYTPLTEVKGGIIPVDDNALVVSAHLKLCVLENLPSSTTITAKRITSLWDYNTVTETNKPTTTATNQATVLTSALAGEYIELDITDMVTDIVDNGDRGSYIWYGIEITTDKASDCKFASWTNGILNVRPYIELVYSLPPRQPMSLRPMGTAVGTLTPVVSAAFKEDDPEDYCTKLQVQVHTTDDFTTPAYDSGQISSTAPTFQIAPAPALTWETDYYWRIRLCDSYGVWSPWSDIGTFTPLELPVIAINTATSTVVANTRRPTNWDFETGVSDWTLTQSNNDYNKLTTNQASVETNITGFTLVGSAISRVLTEYNHGVASLKTITNNAATAEGFYINNTTVTESLDYTASVYLKGSGTVKLRLNERTDADANVGSTSSPVITLTSDWIRYDISRLFGATGKRARLYVETDVQQGITFYTDQLQLEQDDGPEPWHLPGQAVTKTSLVNVEEGTKTCVLNVLNGGAAETDVQLLKTSGSGVSGEHYMLRIGLEATKVMDAKVLCTKAGDPATVYASEALALTGEYQEFEFLFESGTNSLQVMLYVGGEGDFYGVNISYLSINQVTHVLIPTLVHTYTVGDNGAQMLTYREVHYLNETTNMWEIKELHGWLGDTGLTYQVPIGSLKHIPGVYKYLLRVQDGDVQRGALVNSPIYAETTLEFEIIEDDTLLTISDTGELYKVRYEEDHPDITTTGSWNALTTDAEDYSSAQYIDSATTGAAKSLPFYGTGIDVIMPKANNLGKVGVYIDDVLMSTVDLYAASPIYKQVVYTKTDLTLGDHTVKIVVTGTKNSSSSGYTIKLDAFDVTGINIPIAETDVEEAEMDYRIGEDTYDYYRDGLT